MEEQKVLFFHFYLAAGNERSFFFGKVCVELLERIFL
jgi:hypothetical protein